MNAYKQFSYYYDEVVSELDYSLWFDFVTPYLKSNSSILDLACGSGTLSTMFKLKGYDVEGLDLSEEIIEIAKEKSKINHLDIPYHVQDMTNFCLDKKYDVITCFFDSINFLDSLAKVEETFKCVKKHLKPNGYFIFDIFSKTMFKEYTHNHFKKDYHTFKVDWKTSKHNKTTLRHDIVILEGDIEFKESYFEYFYEEKSLNLEGFKLLKKCGDFSDDLHRNDERILIILQAL